MVYLHAFVKWQIDDERIEVESDEKNSTFAKSGINVIDDRLWIDNFRNFG